MARLPRILFGFAAIWALIAGLFIFFVFGSIAVTVTAETSAGGSQQTVSHLSWYESQGWWGIAILVIFALLFYGVAHFYQRCRLAWTVIFGLTAITLSVLAGFSIGTMYWPGSLAILLGLLLLPFQTRPAK